MDGGLSEPNTNGSCGVSTDKIYYERANSRNIADHSAATPVAGAVSGLLESEAMSGEIPESLRETAKLAKDLRLHTQGLCERVDSFCERYDRGDLFRQPYKFFYKLRRKVAALPFAKRVLFTLKH